jgi:hypothetical protein
MAGINAFRKTKCLAEKKGMNEVIMLFGIKSQ